MSGYLKFKLASVGLATLVLSVNGLAAHAGSLVTLKQVQVSGGAQIDLLFDGKISKNQLKTEYFNDIIQISMTDVAVYPAKISSISGGDLMKIFAYQYAPRLVRCRISVRGKAEDYKDRFRILTGNPGGKMLTLALDNGKKSVAAAADALSVSASAPARGQSVSERASDSKSGDSDDKALLDRVMKGTPAAALTTSEARSDESASKNAAHARPLALGGAKPLPSFTGLFVKLALVLGVFGLLAFASRKFLQLRQSGAIAAAVTSGKGKAGILGKLGALGNKSKLIEVLSTQHLGPKKSIVVVKVMERVLVIGISSDSISLITQLGGGADPLLNLDGFEEIEELPVPELSKPSAPQTRPSSGAMAAGPAIFSDLLRAEATKPRIGQGMSAPLTPASKSYLGAGQASSSGTSTASGTASGAGANSVRAQIRSRIEGMKQL